MRRTIDQGLALGIGLLMALIVLNAVLSFRNIRQLDDDAGWVSHTHEVLDQTDDVLLALVDAETGERGFLLTGREEYLQPYTLAVPRLADRLARLKELTSDNAWQQEQLARLEQLSAARLAHLEQRIDRRRKRQFDPDALNAARNGKEQMDAVRALVAEMKQREQDLLRDRERQSRASYWFAVITELLTGCLGLVAVGGLVLLLRRSFQARERMIAAVHEQHEWLRVMLASIGDAVIATDTEGRVALLNPVAEKLTGWKEQEARGQPLENVFHIVNEKSRQPVENPAARALREGTVVGLANHTVLIGRDGSERPIDDSAAPIRNGRGILGVVLVFRDVTERRRAEEARSHLAAIVESSEDAIVGQTLDGVITSWNAGAERLYGYTAEEAIGRPITLILPEDLASEPEDLRERIHRGEPTEHRATMRRHKDGTLLDISVNYSPIRNAQGTIVGISTISRDITRQKRAERTSRFLAEASAALARVVDHESTLQKVARQAVPFFADWCAVDMLDETGQFRRLAVAHVDPAKVELAHELYRRRPPNPDAERGPWHILRTGKSEMIAEITDDFLQNTVQDAETLRVIRELGIKSYMGVPLAIRGKVLGVITFVAAESGRRYDATDLTAAEDLAHRAAVAVENARLYQEVREADRRKDEFLALLGHELRNPLAPIRNALQILKMPGVDGPAGRRAREMMERQVEHLVRLVDDLLDVSRIMRGKLELRRQPVELSTVVHRALETSQTVLDAEGHHLEADLGPKPLWVDGDLVRLAQVVSNLLNNAAKYTERGGRIRLSTRREGNEAVIRVADTGIGLAPELLPRLFEMFFQGERRTRESKGGLGIGLSLVRRLVDLHGGRVEAHSAGPGTGSEFVVRLPLLPAEEPAEQSGQAPESAGEVDSRRVLVVDDNVDAADSLALLLRLEGQEVEVAYDGPSALEKARANPPAIAFLDIGMPKMDGHELARAFRADPVLKNTLLVAVTGWGQPEDRQRTRESGFDQHLVKPVAPEELKGVLTGREPSN